MKACLPALAALAPVLAVALAVPAGAVETSMQIVLQLQGNAERDVVTYDCEGAEEPLTVEYVNAAPVFLAFLPVGGEKLVFVSVLSETGTRYASGVHEWQTSGSEATLTDLTAEEGTPPLACLERSETP